jgi:glycosyltransferase involved in cell wall biosynthesis
MIDVRPMTEQKPISVLAVVQHAYDVSPGQRYRIEEWQPLLEREHGIDITWAPFMDRKAYGLLIKPGYLAQKITATVAGAARRTRDVLRAGKWDCIYILREAAPIGPAFFDRLLAARAPYVFDFDDAIFLPQVSDANRAFAFLKSHRKTETACRLAAHVMAGNAYLASWARQYNADVSVIPTTVDTDRYKPLVRPPNDVPVIGWSGTSTTSMYLRDIREVFTRLAETHNFRLRVIGAGNFEPIAGVACDLIPWTSEGEIDELSKIDIGLMPLRDDDWARGKCGLKALLHMSLAEPVVCSPVGVNADIIENGRNGFLASSTEEWVARLRELLESPELRRRLGAAGRETVIERYSARSQVPRVAEILRLAAKRKAARLAI